ncbi:S-phase kinase-associated protein 1 [Drosophila hydei]|uniref:S-phase kinase-associated protein 1 n=1 Tax=Drosophila hydei TaxID=7224 RepID=A0A6J1M4K3_DROHY|nr:S-phase kinase-associated protein 1 [Drosophila hydei]
MSHPSETLQMRTSDGFVFHVSLEVAQQMGMTHSWLQSERVGLERSDDDDANIMPLDRVSSEIFRLVLNWCHAMQTIEKPLEPKDKLLQERAIFQNLLTESNANDSTIFELIIAADYLNIESLLQAGTQHVADVINGCDSVEAIRERFNIMYDGAVDN